MRPRYSGYLTSPEIGGTGAVGRSYHAPPPYRSRPVEPRSASAHRTFALHSATALARYPFAPPVLTVGFRASARKVLDTPVKPNHFTAQPVSQHPLASRVRNCACQNSPASQHASRRNSAFRTPPPVFTAGLRDSDSARHTIRAHLALGGLKAWLDRSMAESGNAEKQNARLSH